MGHEDGNKSGVKSAEMSTLARPVLLLKATCVASNVFVLLLIVTTPLRGVAVAGVKLVMAVRGMYICTSVESTLAESAGTEVGGSEPPPDTTGGAESPYGADMGHAPQPSEPVASAAIIKRRSEERRVGKEC